jgi:Zn-dependent peptidase ImmA (M78 family)/transcriptional regulator with XRE-family HTH domain
MDVTTAMLCNPERLELVRKARGLSQAQLATLAALSQTGVSLAESNGSTEVAIVKALATALDVPTGILALPVPSDVLVQGCVFRRSRASLPIKVANQVRALLVMIDTHIRNLDGFLPPLLTEFERAGATGQLPIPAARRAASVLGLHESGNFDLVAALERAGFVVVEHELGSRHIDAATLWSDGGRPIILLNADSPKDRRRFTLAHEVAHLLMHESPSEADEGDADRFAAELLMPADRIRTDLGNTSLASVERLRVKWRVPADALIRRARDLGTLSSTDYRTLNIDLSRSGLKGSESRFDGERPATMRQVVAEASAAGMTIENVAGLAMCSSEEFRALYQIGPHP